jgi:hypothetical protein
MERLLYLDRFDVARDRREIFNSLYEREVLRDFRNVQGVLRAAPYQTDSRRDPRYITIFEIAGADVVGSAGWISAAANTPWSDRILPFVMNRQARLYWRVGGGALACATKYLLCVSVDVEPHKEDLMNHLYDTEHIPALRRLSGVVNVVRYRASQGNPAYLAIYEIERPEIPASKEWAIASDTGRWKLEVKPYLYNASFVVYEALGGDLAVDGVAR